MATRKSQEKAELALRAVALGYPETTEDFPWGHRAIKVRGKAFVFMAREEGELSMSVKLPSSRFAALMLPFAEPTGYGLGKSGWVTARFASSDPIPVDLLSAWLDESYRAIAPKKVSAQIVPVPKPAKAKSTSRKRRTPSTKKKKASPRS